MNIESFDLYNPPSDFIKNVYEYYNLLREKSPIHKNPDGSYHFSIEMKAKLRNDFETPMLVAFISVGQAISHQEKFAKKKKSFKPVIPNDTEVTVITTLSRDGMVISAKAKPEQLKQLAEGKIDTAGFMRLIKNSIQTL